MKNKSAPVLLKVASVIVMVFGVSFVLAAHPDMAFPTEFLIDLAFWPVDGAQDFSSPVTRLMFAISGGVLFGWGVMLWIIVTQLYPLNPGLARTMIIAGASTWFIVDSTGSVIAGAPFNALLNVPFLLIFVLPLWQDSDAMDVKQM